MVNPSPIVGAGREGLRHVLNALLTHIVVLEARGLARGVMPTVVSEPQVIIQIEVLLEPVPPASMTLAALCAVAEFTVL